MSRQLQELIGLLDLEQIEDNLFRAYHPAERRNRLYGGQIMAQALMAAARTVAAGEASAGEASAGEASGHAAPRAPHSLHGYFLRPGDPKVPAVIKVENLRDGRSFSSRRITVLQRGEAIFNMDASFQVAQSGPQHQFEMPHTQPPAEDSIPPYLRDSAFISWREDFRRLTSSTPQPPRQNVWFRSNGTVADDPVLQACLLVYESDNALLGTSRLPHRGRYDPERMQVASLDHAIWFHHPVDVSAWLLYALDAPSSSAGRGLNRGLIYTREGVLVASTVQEGLIRVR